MIILSDGINTTNKKLDRGFPRRTDWQKIGLDDDLSVTADLVAGLDRLGALINGVGAETFGEGFDVVTNYLSMDNKFKQPFIQLLI